MARFLQRDKDVESQEPERDSLLVESMEIVIDVVHTYDNPIEVVDKSRVGLDESNLHTAFIDQVYHARNQIDLGTFKGDL